MSLEYVLYTDESKKEGKFFANFYGGALVRSVDLEQVRADLVEAATSVGLTGEAKWQKVSAAYLDRYKALMDAFFNQIAAGRVKVRIMFTQTRYVPTGLTPYQREHEYFLLYYQFLKHAFGLAHSNSTNRPIRLRIYLDKLPDTKEKNAVFKGHVAGLAQSKAFRAARIAVPADQIADVDSHEHIVLQCLDVVLGAMQFRLNELHKEKPAGQAKRGNRTIAKEKLYKHINIKIREIYPNFNVGTSTGTPNGPRDRWEHQYRHWLFIPQNADIDASRGKRK